MTMMKNRTDHMGEKLIVAKPSGYTWNTKPGPVIFFFDIACLMVINF